MDTVPANGVCLADYCEMFEVCDGNQRGQQRQRMRDPQCDEAGLQAARRRCEAALRDCLPLDEEVTRKLHGHLSRHWCQSIDCRIRAEKQKEHFFEDK